MMSDGLDAESLARDMIDVHGTEAAAVARENARSAALAGQAMQAKSWLGVLGIIQRQQAGKSSSPCGSDNSPAAKPAKG